MTHPTLLVIDRPDDWHLHLRDGAAMASAVGHSARRFGRAIVMPNLRPPITDVPAAVAYRQRILAALPPDSRFDPLMTLYLTDHLPPSEITRAKASGIIYAAKLYPAGATTHSDRGVTDVGKIYPVLEAMERCHLPLLIHGEVTDPQVDVFDRERRFIDDVLCRLIRDFPGLKIVFEHITTAEAVDFVRAGPPTLAATITPHHLLHNRTAMFAGGIRPHFYCLPVLKRESHRQALLAAIASGDPKFFLGTDSAPHRIQDKESACGCAGIFNAHAAIEFYAMAFESIGALSKLEGFASWYGADFYGLPRPEGKLHLRREPWQIPNSYPLGDGQVVPLGAGEVLHWRIGD